MRMLLTAASLLATLSLANLAYSADKLVIISPHRKSIQNEFMPLFKDYYKETFKTDIEIDWLDQGGTSDDLRFVRAKFAKNPQTSGIDVFWGGGGSTFIELAQSKLLQDAKLDPKLRQNVPAEIAGVVMSENHWHATAISSFGVFYNKQLLKIFKIDAPKSWSDLKNPSFQNRLSLADPRRSGSARTLNFIVLQSMGWDAGWELLTQIAGNTRKFTHSSSDPIKAVVAGDAAASMAIDFYAAAKIADLGSESLGFVLPEGQTVLDPDPVAVLKGAPNEKEARRFVEFLLSPQAQKLFILPKGAPGGPKFASLGRMAVNKVAYEDKNAANAMNPFKLKKFMKLDSKKAGELQRIFTDLIGAIHVDTHKELKSAWKAVVRRGLKPEDVAEFGRPPLSEEELINLAAKWDDDVVRNQSNNPSLEVTRKKYRKLANPGS